MVRCDADAAVSANTKLSSPATNGIAQIAARRCLKPYRQGELDFLCGVYAPINAMRLALADVAPLSKVDCKRLIAAGCRYLDAKGGLHQALTWGMDLRRRHALARHLARLISTPHLTVSVERPDHRNLKSIDDVFGWIEVSLAAGKPVLAYFANLPDHYTVVAGITPTTLQLFDSAGMHFVRRARCGLQRGAHHIPANGLLRIAAARSA